ncbi:MULTISPECIES: hypothetical protein [Bartonella]|uniref:Uncharacterized protein n=1 Tax=Bartonella chomelii TaxID=236402 RepID=A0ABR6E3B4_9HYPH|nr:MULTISPECIES: hypothetical protein [Bartonella]MBA9083050.1 hypothetical protein [Bartonella chomelii]
MSVKGLTQDVANIFASTDLHFGEQDSDTTNGAFLNISCTDHNKWTTNYGQGVVSLVKNDGGNKNKISPNKRSRRSSWFRRHSLSF